MLHLFQVTPPLKLKMKKKGKKFADHVLSSLVIILLFLSDNCEIFTPYLIYIIAPGFIENQIKFDLAVELTRLLYFLFFVSLSSFFLEFLIPIINLRQLAAAPIILNIVLIISLILSYVQN